MEEDRLFHPRHSANPALDARRPPGAGASPRARIAGTLPGPRPAEPLTVRTLLSPTRTKAEFV